MSIENNKRLVTRFASHFGRSDIDAMIADMADDVRWWINADPALFPVAGAITKAEFEAINRDMHAGLDAGLPMRVVGMVAEDDHVAAELHARAVTKSGQVYDNDYHMLFTLRDGRIAAVDEYVDLMTVARVFPLPPVHPTATDTAPERHPGNAIDPRGLRGSKRVIANFLTQFGRGDIAAALDMMTDDATWWVNGKPDLFPDAGTRTKAQMADAWPRMLDLLDDALELIPQTLVEEGDRVVAQVRSRALTKRGKRYQNGFLFLFTLRDSKVAAVREYTDLIHAASVFG